MLYTAQDLRTFVRGRTPYERVLMTSFDEINAATRNAAMMGHSSTKVHVKFDTEFAQQIRKDISARLTKAGFCTSMEDRPMNDLENRGKSCLAITISW